MEPGLNVIEHEQGIGHIFVQLVSLARCGELSRDFFLQALHSSKQTTEPSSLALRTLMPGLL